MDSKAALEQRQVILDLLDRGLNIAQVSKRLGCSRTTIYKVLRRKVNNLPLADARKKLPGRAPIYDDHIYSIVLKLRAETPTHGPVMLHARLKRTAAAHGLTESEVPSASSIANLIHSKGLAHKPIGPRDNRRYPVHTPAAPGAISIDTWGPWNVRAERLYLATIQDRYTRLVAAVPAMSNSARMGRPNLASQRRSGRAPWPWRAPIWSNS